MFGWITKSNAAELEDETEYFNITILLNNGSEKTYEISHYEVGDRWVSLDLRDGWTAIKIKEIQQMTASEIRTTVQETDPMTHLNA